MELLLKPFVWLLLLFYNTLHNYGLTLILFAIVIKTVLFPVTLKAKKGMIQSTMLSGQMQKLKAQYGKDAQRYNAEVQKLYARENVNPMGGCLWSLIPMVVLIALIYIIREPLVLMMGVPKSMIGEVAAITGVKNVGVYPQIAMVQALGDPAILAQVKDALGEAGANIFAMDFSFFGLNLAEVPKMKFWVGEITASKVGLALLPVLSTIVSFFSMRVTTKTNKINSQESNEQMERTNQMMMGTMPLMSLWIGFTVPAGLSVYWIAQYLITMVQEIICGKLLKKDYEAAKVAAEEREQREKEEEKQRKEQARLERAERIEQEKKNRGKKKPAQKAGETEQAGIRKADSREGMRTYARGRAYIPDRFGGVTAYVDPNETTQTDAQQEETEDVLTQDSQQETFESEATALAHEQDAEHALAQAVDAQEDSEQENHEQDDNEQEGHMIQEGEDETC